MKTYPLLITLIAGLSTLIGYFFIYIKNNKNIIPKCLSFSAGAMITLSVIDLIPKSIEYFSYTLKDFILFIIFITLGFFISHFLNKKIKEEGLYKTGIMSMIGIMIHNIPEGIATYTLSTIDLKLGLILAIAIIMHNIPEGISIAIPIYYSTKNKIKAITYTLIAGLSELFGAIITMLFLYKYMNNTILGILFSTISGLMMYIGYYELIKSSLTYSKKITKVYVIIGSIFIILIEILLKI